MATIATLLLELGADVKGLKAGVKGAEAQIKRLNKAFDFAKKAALGFGGIQVVRSLAGFVTSTAKAADAVGKLSDRLGVSTDFIQEFRFAAELSGVAAGNVDTALQRVQRRFGEVARTGRGTAAPALKELSEDLFEAVRAGASFEEVLPELADHLKAIDNDARRLSIAFQLFDTEGAQLVQLLNKGSEGFEKFRREAREAGAVIDKELIESAAEFNDNLQKFNTNIAAVGRTLAWPFIKGVNNAADALDHVSEHGFRIFPAGPPQLWFGELDYDFQGPPAPVGPSRAAALTGIADGESRVNTETNIDLQYEDMLTRMREAQAEFNVASRELWSQWAAQASDIVGQISISSLQFFQSFTSGFGDAISRVIVFGEDFASAMTKLFQSMAALVIRTLVKMLVEAAVAKVAVRLIEKTVHASRMAAASQLVHMAAFASAVGTPFVGPFIAPGVAASAVTAAIAGSAASAAKGAAASVLNVEGASEGGFVTSTGLVNVHAGELIGTPDRIQQLTGGMGDQTIILNLDGRQLARSTVKNLPETVNLYLGSS